MAAHQAPLSLGFSRQEYWSGLPFPSPTQACMLSCFSRVQLCATPWTPAHQALLSTGFSRQEYWSGLPFPSPCQYLYHLYLSNLYKLFTQQIEDVFYCWSIQSNSIHQIISIPTNQSQTVNQVKSSQTTNTEARSSTSKITSCYRLSW